MLLLSCLRGIRRAHLVIAVHTCLRLLIPWVSSRTVLHHPQAAGLLHQGFSFIFGNECLLSCRRNRHESPNKEGLGTGSRSFFAFSWFLREVNVLWTKVSVQIRRAALGLCLAGVLWPPDFGCLVQQEVLPLCKPGFAKGMMDVPQGRGASGQCLAFEHC